MTRSTLQSKVRTLEKRLLESPEVERKYRSILRNYENANLKYTDVKAKLSEAKIGESLELGEQSEKFTIIEPPLLPQQPVSPNRPVILVLGVLLSGMAALGIALLRENVDDGVYDRQTIFKLTGYVPLAILPTMSTIEEVSRIKRARIIALISLILIVILFFVLVHFLYSPLDVLYYRALRKI